ncbi:hypothetical protein MMC34_006615 [Xylographa carneopallida]|nr:hypothetical protein [Xylographa carneopallida]
MPSFSATSTGAEVVAAFEDRLAGKTVLITGASAGGLGAATALALATGHPKTLILAGRTEAKVHPVIEHIRKTNPAIDVSFLPLDLTDHASVKRAAAAVDAKVEALDVLINNAGLMAVKAFEKTGEGVEVQFAANHVGHFLLTGLLLGKLRAAGKATRVVNVSSLGYTLSEVRFEDWNFQDGKEYNAWKAYGQAKTANILFAQSLADRLAGSGGQAYAVHPGFVPESKLQSNTAVTTELFMQGMELAEEKFGAPAQLETPKTLEQGCATQIWAALCPDIGGPSGNYLTDCSVVPLLVPHASGEDNKRKLWALSEKLVGQKFT